MSEYEYETIEESAAWPAAVRKIATHHPVLGGEDESPLNVAAKDLADRTRYLYETHGWTDPVVLAAVGDEFVVAIEIPWAHDGNTGRLLLEVDIWIKDHAAYKRVLLYGLGPSPSMQFVHEVAGFHLFADSIEVQATGFLGEPQAVRLSVRWNGPGTRDLVVSHRVVRHDQWQT